MQVVEVRPVRLLYFLTSKADANFFSIVMLKPFLRPSVSPSWMGGQKIPNEPFR